MNKIRRTFAPRMFAVGDILIVANGADWRAIDAVGDTLISGNFRKCIRYAREFIARGL